MIEGNVIQIISAGTSIFAVTDRGEIWRKSCFAEEPRHNLGWVRFG